MHKNNDFSISNRIKSFGYAFAGIYILITSQHNTWIHICIAVLVVICGLLFQVNAIEWAILIFAIVIVLVSEALNTAIEFLCDLVSPDQHPLIKKSKDVAAGAVLISAFGAAIIGLIIFLPYIKAYL
jgi:diacylglycerol kinase